MNNETFINKPNLANLSQAKESDNMVQALVQIDDNTNRVLNIVKAKYGLTDKGEAIELVVNKYIEKEDEPELKPEFIKKINQIRKQKSVRVKNFAKRYGLK